MDGQEEQSGFAIGLTRSLASPTYSFLASISERVDPWLASERLQLYIFLAWTFRQVLLIYITAHIRCHRGVVPLRHTGLKRSHNSTFQIDVESLQLDRFWNSCPFGLSGTCTALSWQEALQMEGFQIQWLFAIWTPVWEMARPCCPEAVMRRRGQPC